MKVKVGEILDIEAEEGIWLDYENHIWYFFVKDANWTKEELSLAKRNQAFLRFVHKNDIDLFLLEIEDCLECSDIPICMSDADDALKKSLQDDLAYAYRIVLLDGDNKVVVMRVGSMKDRDSAMLKEQLKKQDLDDTRFDQTYQKLMDTTEPFEMEEEALFLITNREGA